MTNGRVQGLANIRGKTRLEYICISEICFPAYWADSSHFGENRKNERKSCCVLEWFWVSQIKTKGIHIVSSVVKKLINNRFCVYLTSANNAVKAIHMQWRRHAAIYFVVPSNNIICAVLWWSQSPALSKILITTLCEKQCVCRDLGKRGMGTVMCGKGRFSTWFIEACNTADNYWIMADMAGM